MAGSDPDHPGLVRIYKSPEVPNDRYENAWRTGCHLAQKFPMAACVALRWECPPVGGHPLGQHGGGPRRAAGDQTEDRRPARPPQHRGELSGAAMPMEKRFA